MKIAFGGRCKCSNPMLRFHNEKKIVQSPLIKQNCWEFLRCGREPGGEKAEKSGICPASVETSVDGLNGGKNGGRICWAISGTFCARVIEGFFAKKQLSCRSCVFFKKVREEEGFINFHPVKYLVSI